MEISGANGTFFMVIGIFNIALEASVPFMCTTY